MQPLEDDLNIELGYCCRPRRVGMRIRASQSRRPGTRAPHVWLDRDGERISTLDLFGRGFVLLAGPEGGAWHERAASRS